MRHLSLLTVLPLLAACESGASLTSTSTLQTSTPTAGHAASSGAGTAGNSGHPPQPPGGQAGSSGEGGSYGGSLSGEGGAPAGQGGSPATAGTAGTGGNSGGAGGSNNGGSGAGGSAGTAVGCGEQGQLCAQPPQLMSGNTGNCLVRADGKLLCWGEMQVTEMPWNQPVVQVARTVGHDGQYIFPHTCVLLASHEVHCWGNGADGQLGYPGKPSISAAEATWTPAVQLGGDAWQVVAGAQHTCALLQGGQVRCWGTGTRGQLGHGKSEGPPPSSQLPVDTDVLDLGGPVAELAAGTFHTCALLQGGQVRCWGRGSEGQLGHGSTQDIGDDESPASAGDVALGGKALRIVAGGHHTCALLEGGAVRCWGDNAHGQLGLGSTESIGDDELPSSQPVVNVGGAVEQISTGDRHTCAVLGGGGVRCWGYGPLGVLGYGNRQIIGDDETPASAGDVAVGEKALQVAAGADQTCALLASGAVRCWGSDRTGGSGKLGRIGDDEAPGSLPPIDVGGQVKQLEVGGAICVLRTDGPLICWGYGWDGALGNGPEKPLGDDEPPSTIAPINFGGPQALQVELGYKSGCAQIAPSKLRCWGKVEFPVQGKPVGNGPAQQNDDLDMGAEIVSLDTNGVRVCVVLGTGAVRCWSSPPFLGYPQGSSGSPLSPQDLGDIELGGKALQVVTGGTFVCALLEGGSVRCWGESSNGALGYGHTQAIGDDETPASAGDVPLGAKALRLAAGDDHVCALLETNKVRCWGDNTWGQLGYALPAQNSEGEKQSIGDDETPASVGDVEIGGDVTQLALGSSHSCALLASGAVRCWGYGGLLGYGHQQIIGDDETPASAGDLDLGGKAIQLRAGQATTCALLETGELRCWGYGYELGYSKAILGDDELPSSVEPVIVP